MRACTRSALPNPLCRTQMMLDEFTRAKRDNQFAWMWHAAAAWDAFRDVLARGLLQPASTRCV